MLFQSKQIRGEGRGHKVGFPTINLAVPSDLVLDDGIYAAWIVINDVTYKGALHYGPIPTFGQKDKTMEVYLLDVTDANAPETENVAIEVDIVSHIRDVWKFTGAEDLAVQIDKDVKNVRAILK
jgi:riboflavin kinase/FMN adenylyltransferase